jgi:vitamin B12 transporter
MRSVRNFVFTSSLIVWFVAAASATELRVKVVDPLSAAVPGAIVSLSRPGESTIVATQTTAAEGTTTLRVAASESYRLRVVAPGFAVEELTVAGQEKALTVQLRLAPASETVVVSATRTPVEGEAAGADVATLSNAQLAAMPVGVNDGVRFLPGVIVNTAGQRGGLSSVFVRGGESRYNKVIVDGVTVNEPGGTFDASTLPLVQADRVELVRGAQSTLYGSDAMTSLVQVWTRTGVTHTPELRVGADGGNFSTANGYGSLAGSRGRFDYNLFGDQFNTSGAGINNAYSDSLAGANVGMALSETASVRVRVRRSNSHSGVSGEWNFNGTPLEPPDAADSSHLSTVLGSVELALAAPSGWQHHLTGFDYSYRYDELNPNGDPNRIFDFPSHEVDHINRTGFEYQGDYSERTWAHTTFGYRVENENGFVGDVNFGQTHGQRLNDDAYAQQQIVVRGLSVIAGARFVHDSAFGNTGVPRIAATFQAVRGNETFSGTRLRFSYATGFKEPRLEETFAGPPFSDPNTGLKPERVRAFEAGIQQNFLNNKYVLNATYFNNLFHDQINYVTVDPINFIGQYVNVNEAIAHGAEVGIQGKVQPRLLLNVSYTYLSTQILEDPVPFPPTVAGAPLLRRPKHSATLQLNYLGSRWGSNLSAGFVGRRPDSDFLGFNIDHAAGYVRADVGGWYELHPRVTAYLNIENALDRRYNEVVGYPALPINFRAGLRFRIGGE